MVIPFYALQSTRSNAYEAIVQYRGSMGIAIQKNPGKTLRVVHVHALFPLSIFTEPLQFLIAD